MGRFAVPLRVLAAALAVAVACALAPSASAATPERTGRAILITGEQGGAETRGSLDRVRDRLRRAAARAGLGTGRQIPELGAAVVDPRGATIAQLRSRLVGHGGIVAVEPEYRRSVTAATRRDPNDPAFASNDPRAPGGVQGQWNLVRQNFPAAWARSTGEGVKVGVIDTGIDGGHPDLGPQIDEAVSTSGFSRDARRDEDGHGTHVAGLACGRADDGFGIAGAGFRCRLEVQKTDLSDSSIAASINDATDRGVGVMNLSFGGPGDATILRRAVERAMDRDVLVVAAAANSPGEEQGAPARYVQPTGTGPEPEQGRGLVVTAAGFDDRRASFAGRGSQISIAAYGHAGSGGSGILSTFPGYRVDLERATLLPPSSGCGCRTEVAGDDRFAYLAGTSMATPQVVGAAALVRWINPTLSNREVASILKRTARRSGGWSPELGWGILDAGAAVEAALLAEGNPPSSRTRSASRVRSTTLFRVRVSSQDPGGFRASGVREVRVYARANGQRGYRRVRTLRGSRLKSDGSGLVRFRGRRGRTYWFYSRAVDAAGNLEPLPRRAETRTRVLRRR